MVKVMKRDYKENEREFKDLARDDDTMEGTEEPSESS